jgi:protein-arginine kinase activator protein McsA
MNIIYKLEEPILSIIQEEVAITTELGNCRTFLYNWVDSIYPMNLIPHIKALPTSEIAKLTMNYPLIQSVIGLSDKLSRKKFSGEIIKCTKAGCVGIIYTDNNSVNTCNLCDTVMCIECYTTFDTVSNTTCKDTVSTHICDQDTKKSIEFIKKNSKNCPKCNIRISHIEGCNQMFCVYCNTAFNWDTLVIYKTLERYHNPHHQQFIKNNRNVTRESDCDINVLEDMIHEISNLLNTTGYKHLVFLKGIIRAIRETRGSFNTCIRYNPQDYLNDLRRKYVRENIDKKTFLNMYWKNTITLQKNEILQEISNNMYISASEIVIDVFQRNCAMYTDVYQIIRMFTTEFNDKKKLFA